MIIEDKLSKVRFCIDKEPHIKVRTELCETCVEKPCLFVCPVQNYTFSDGKMVFSWQGCMECGACRISCPNYAITWAYPRGGFGVCLRYG
ncbi:MAG: 4Fe-4S binding protein [Pseudomonadota bacterium]